MGYHSGQVRPGRFKAFLIPEDVLLLMVFRYVPTGGRAGQVELCSLHPLSRESCRTRTWTHVR